ncbi:hypothetical protein A2U01_0087015, partial [Trifolium medium]|nr:hypothetical protein [Trifolium medium]
MLGHRGTTSRTVGPSSTRCKNSSI